MSSIEYPLPVPGPDPNASYTVRKPIPSSGSTASAPADLITVSVTYQHSASPLTFSFILAAAQALPWIDNLAANLPLNATATLHAHSGGESVASVTLRSLTRPTPQSQEELRAEANAIREDGNAIFKNPANEFKDYKAAMLRYANALDRSRLAGHDSAFDAKIRSNLALACIRTCEWTPAIAHCDAAIQRVGDDAKLLYRRALAAVELDLGVRALSDLRRAEQLCTDDALIRRERQRVQREAVNVLAKRRQHFAEVYNVMLHSPIFKDPALEKT